MLYPRFDFHNHTGYSNLRGLDSINSAKSLIERAKEIGLAGIAVTDHESLGAHVEIDKLILQYHDIRIVRGNEIYLTDTRDKNQRYWHFILLALDAVGHKMLRELSSNAWINSYFDRGIERVPTLKSELEACIAKYGQGHLHLSTACLGSEIDVNILRWDEAEKNNDIIGIKEAKRSIKNYIDFLRSIAGEGNFSLEIQPARSQEQLIVSKKMIELSKIFNLDICITSDAHYLTKDDRNIHKAFLNSQNIERETDSFYQSCYLQSQEDILENIKGLEIDYEQLCANSMKILDKCEDYTIQRKQHVVEVEVKDYPKRQIESKKYPTLSRLYNSDNPQERYWVNFCVDELKKRNLYNKTYLSRLELEADIMDSVGNNLNTCVFAYPNFLQHYIDLIWECGSPVGVARGSAAAGLNHYLMGLCQLDPIKHDFMYERFLNKDRDEMPDVDIDLSPTIRPKIFEKIREERGQLDCVQVCTYGTVSTKAAVKIACRGYTSERYPDGIDVDIAEYITSLIPSERGFLYSLDDCFNGNEEKGRKPNKTFIIEVAKYPGLKEIMLGIDGLISQRSTHASGVIFFNGDPFDEACFMKSKDGSLITQWSLHDQEACGSVKYDFLVTQQMDIVAQCLKMLQEHGYIDRNLTLRQAYDKTIHPDVLPMDDEKLWDAIDSTDILSLFQLTSQVGSQTVKKLVPRNIKELNDVNGIMRLMADDSGVLPTDRYAEMKAHPEMWEHEMDEYGLTEDEKNVIKKYVSCGVLIDQETLMRIVMDPDVCGFSLKESNSLRKTVAKKHMDEIPQQHQKILDTAKSPAMGKYIWFLLQPSMGYSFSSIHGTSYSYIACQAAYLATYFPSIYWNTAYLRVVSGMDTDDTANYDKIARAIGDIQKHGVSVSTIDVNKSGETFEPDEDNNLILYGMRALNGVGGDVTQQIIANRPYKNVTEFVEKNNPNKSVMISLIKAGAFDEFHDRITCMRWYLTRCSEPKKKITLANFQGLIDKGLVDDNMAFCKRLYVFNKSLRSKCKHGDFYRVTGRYMTFYEQFFDTDELEIVDGETMIAQKKWQKMYTKAMEPAKKWIADEQEDILKKFNGSLFQEQWNKYALGTQLTWEMDSLGFYSHGHELEGVDKKMYGISNFEDLPEEGYRNSARIQGTVIAKNDMKSSVAILTPECGVVDVKFNRDAYASYNRRISEVNPDGTKTCIEEGWFSKGTLLFVDGYRRGNMFVARAPRGGNMLYKIVGINGFAVACVSERADT